MKFFLLLIFSVITLDSVAQKDIGLQSIELANSEAIVAVLSSDLIEGREAGMVGAHRAAEYIASKFIDYNIQPLEGGEAGLLEKYFHSFDTTKLSPIFCVEPQQMRLRNVLGKIEGNNPDEIVIIGAHYDHYGIRKGEIYNGADDNATGVAAVLQIARAFMKSEVKPERTIIFALWDGEEKGLLGSSHFVKHCDYLDKIKGYMNFDMIGRNSNEDNPTTLTYFYTASSPDYGTWMREAVFEHSLNLDPRYNAWDNPTGGSDNASFAKHGIPIAWYHTEGHPDYHKPTDTYEKLNWAKMLDIVKSAYLTFWNMANL